MDVTYSTGAKLIEFSSHFQANPVGFLFCPASGIAKKIAPSIIWLKFFDEIIHLTVNELNNLFSIEKEKWRKRFLVIAPNNLMICTHFPNPFFSFALTVFDWFDFWLIDFQMCFFFLILLVFFCPGDMLGFLIVDWPCCFDFLLCFISFTIVAFGWWHWTCCISTKSCFHTWLMAKKKQKNKDLNVE